MSDTKKCNVFSTSSAPIHVKYKGKEMVIPPRAKFMGLEMNELKGTEDKQLIVKEVVKTKSPKKTEEKKESEEKK